MKDCWTQCLKCTSREKMSFTCTCTLIHWIGVSLNLANLSKSFCRARRFRNLCHKLSIYHQSIKYCKWSEKTWEQYSIPHSIWSISLLTSILNRLMSKNLNSSRMTKSLSNLSTSLSVPRGKTSTRNIKCTRFYNGLNTLTTCIFYLTNPKMMN